MTSDRNSEAGADQHTSEGLTEQTIAKAEAALAAVQTDGPQELMGMEDPVLCFRVGPTWFAVPAVEAREVSERTKIFSLPRSPTHIPGVISESGRVTPLLDLQDFLQLPSDTTEEAVDEQEALTGRVVVVTAGGMRVGIICDRVTGVMEFEKDHWRETGTEMGDQYQGMVDALIQTPMGLVMVLNVEHLLAAARVK